MSREKWALTVEENYGNDNEVYWFIASVRRQKYKCPEGTVDYKGEDISGKEYELTEHRTWGFYKDKKRAMKAVRENWTDMYECGCYPWVIIEPHYEGLLVEHIGKAIWYEWNKDKAKYCRMKTKPYFAEHTCGFALN